MDGNYNMYSMQLHCTSSLDDRICIGCKDFNKSHDLEKGKIVYELTEGKFLPVKDRVSHWSVEETVRRYYLPTRK